MNRISVSQWWSVFPARRGRWKGPLLCAAIVASAAAVSILPLSRRSTGFRAPSSSIRGARLSVSAIGNRNAAGNLADMGWSFEPNLGQSAPSVKFLARAHDATIFLTSSSLYISWPRGKQRGDSASVGKSDVLQLQFANANPTAAVSGQTLLPGKTNYFIGRNPHNWHTDVPHFRAVHYAGLYPGVDARFYGGSRSLEYDLDVAPRSDLNRIRLRATGAGTLHTDAHGDLLMWVGSHELSMKRPEIYQVENGSRIIVSGGYRLLAENEIGFEIGKHRSDLPLIIDPTISVAYTTFLGGAGEEKGNSVAVDASGAIYVGGTTTDVTTFPETTTCNDIKSITCAGAAAGATSNLFVAKVDMHTSPPSLVYLTFIGGSGSDQGGMVALDHSASPPNLAILGWSTSKDFPITMGTVPSGGANLTISDLNGTGNGFIYSEYLGGSGSEANQNAGGISTDSVGDVFVTSDTSSVDFPTTPATAYQPAYIGPGNDAILAEFAAGSGALTYSTYLGLDASTVGGTGVAVDSSGNAYVGGFTSTTSTSFPPGGFQTTYPGGSLDGFVMEINPTMAGPGSLVYGTFIGGSQPTSPIPPMDKVLSIAVDTATPPNAYVTGVTQSNNLIPSSAVIPYSPFQSSLGTGAAQNGFFAVINQSVGPAPIIPSLQYITYLGGNASDAAQGVAVFSPTQVYVAGNATSTNFPSLCTLQGFSGSQDAFLTEFNPTVAGASSLLSATFLGGTATAQANAVSAGPAGNAILFGDTLSNDYPLAGNPGNGFQTICSSCQSSPTESDAFLTKLAVGSGTSGCVAFYPLVVTFGSFNDGTTAPPVAVQVTNDGNANLNVTSETVTGANSGDFSLSDDSCISSSPIAPSGTCNFEVTFTPSIIGPETAAAQITDDGANSPQVLNLSGIGAGVGVTLSPGSSLSFPNTPQDAVSNEQTITLTNISADGLAVSESSLQGANPGDFELGSPNTCVSSGPISPGGSCTVAFQFAPTEMNPPAAGEALSAQDVLTLQDTINHSTQTITISLFGNEVSATPTIVLSPTSLAFSSETVGSSTAPQVITITNTTPPPPPGATGWPVLSISSISITGTNQADFTETNTCPATLAIGANCTVSVKFEPGAAGPLSASVSVSDNAASSPQTVGLSGTGTAAGVTLSPSTLVFAGQNVGTPASSPQPVTLQNTGNGPLTISRISITGTDSSDFQEKDNCPTGGATLNPSSACSIAVTFEPTATGSRTASLSVVDNAVPATQTVSLSGLGTAPGAQLNVSSIPFNPAVVGSQSAASPAQVSNIGNGPLTISSISFSGANPGDFKASGSCTGPNGSSVTVPAGSNCTVNVVFAPTAAGIRSAVMNVNDSAASSPQQVSTSGIATDFQLAVAASGSTSVTISAGETATFNLQASPINGFSGTLAMSCADPIPASTCTISPQQLSVSGTQPIPFTASITTTAPTSSFLAPFALKTPRQRNILLAAFGLLAFALLNFWRRRPLRRFRLAFLLAGALLLCSCGGGSSNSSSNGTPAGTYTVTVNAAISGTTRTVALTVTVQ